MSNKNQTVLQKLKKNVQQSQILSSDTKIIVSALIFNMLEEEKEQIYNSFIAGATRGTDNVPFNCEQYYSQTFKND